MVINLWSATILIFIALSFFWSPQNPPTRCQMYKVVWSRERGHQSERLLRASCKQEPMESMALAPAEPLRTALRSCFPGLISLYKSKTNQDSCLPHGVKVMWARLRVDKKKKKRRNYKVIFENILVWTQIWWLLTCCLCGLAKRSLDWKKKNTTECQNKHFRHDHHQSVHGQWLAETSLPWTTPGNSG